MLRTSKNRWVENAQRHRAEKERHGCRYDSFVSGMISGGRSYFDETTEPPVDRKRQERRSQPRRTALEFVFPDISVLRQARSRNRR
jgi:hypothetical protein